MLQELNNNGETWMDRLEMLCVKFAHLGVGAELPALSLMEARGLYVYLDRLANG